MCLCFDIISCFQTICLKHIRYVSVGTGSLTKTFEKCWVCFQQTLCLIEKKTDECICCNSSCFKEEQKNRSISIRHPLYCILRGLHALGRAIVNKINLQLKKNTLLIIQSWKMLIFPSWFTLTLTSNPQTWQRTDTERNWSLSVVYSTGEEIGIHLWPNVCSKLKRN